MSPQPEIASVPIVSTDKGAELQARRKAIGMSVRALAERASVDRATIPKVEAGERVRGYFEIVGALDKALSEIEHEFGMDLPSQVAPLRPIGDPSEGMVEFEITGNFGVKAVVKGPVANLAELQEAARRLIADMGEDRPKG